MKNRYSSMTLIAALLVLSACQTMDERTQGAVVGGAIGCAGGAILAKFTKNDMGTACAAGAVVGAAIGYMNARRAEVQEAQQTTEAVAQVPGATAAPVQTETIEVTDRQTRKTEKVDAFKSVSVDIPVRQLNTKDGKDAVAKLDAYARKVAMERGETVSMTVATAPSDKPGASKVGTQRVSSEAVGKGSVRRISTIDANVPPTVQRYTIEVKNRDKVEV